jgi:hypothetical protein
MMTSQFTPAEQQVLRDLRARYLKEDGLWSARELARLRFFRWLYQSGRVAGTETTLSLIAST